MQRGRPKLSENDLKSMRYVKAINLRLTEEQIGKIKVIARNENQSVQQLMRDLIDSKISEYNWVGE